MPASTKRTQIIALALLALAAVFVAFIAWRTRQPPFLPQDRVHAAFVNGETCLAACHAAGGPQARTEHHPIGTDCLRCHGRR